MSKGFSKILSFKEYYELQNVGLFKYPYNRSNKEKVAHMFDKMSKEMKPMLFLEEVQISFGAIKSKEDDVSNGGKRSVGSDPK